MKRQWMIGIIVAVFSLSSLAFGAQNAECQGVSDLQIPDPNKGQTLTSTGDQNKDKTKSKSASEVVTEDMSGG